MYKSNLYTSFKFISLNYYNFLLVLKFMYLIFYLITKLVSDIKNLIILYKYFFITHT